MHFELGMCGIYLFIFKTILRIQADVMEMRGHVFELEREHEEDADEASIGKSKTHPPPPSRK